MENEKDLNIKYGDFEIKQHMKETYLGYILDDNLSEESMATKILSLGQWEAEISILEAKFSSQPFTPIAL